MSQPPLPTHRRPTTPGEVIAEEFLRPLGITQQRFADAMRMSRVGINAILKGRRAVTPETAFRLERVLGPSAQFWLNLQMMVDLYDAAHSPAQKDIRRLKQLVSA